MFRSESPALQAKEPVARGTQRLLYVSLTLVLVGGLGAYLLKTDFGKIDVMGFKLPTENGQWVSADLFRPRVATTIPGLSPRTTQSCAKAGSAAACPSYLLLKRLMWTRKIQC